jgi:hypothetical protein
LNASDVVAALAMDKQYIPIWEYVKREFEGILRARLFDWTLNQTGTVTSPS